MLRWILISWAANALVLGITAWLLDSVSAGNSFWTVVFAAALFGLTAYSPTGESMRAVVATTVVWVFSRLAFWIGYHHSATATSR